MDVDGEGILIVDPAGLRDGDELVVASRRGAALTGRPA